MSLNDIIINYLFLVQKQRIPHKITKHTILNDRKQMILHRDM